jgi:hypothetical protein
MLKVYDIENNYNHGQTHSVVSEDIAEAERIYKREYGPVTINQITLHSEYVLVQNARFIGQDNKDYIKIREALIVLKDILSDIGASGDCFAEIDAENAIEALDRLTQAVEISGEVPPIVVSDSLRRG